MLTLKRTTSENPDFRTLVKLLDEDLAIRDGSDHAFFSQYNKIDAINYAVVAYFNGFPAGCGAIKKFDYTSAEVKRMYVRPENRGNGIAKAILKELEMWAAELNYSSCVLETGKRQPEAIALYQGCGYSLIPNYGQYENVETSVCMKKTVGDLK